MRIITIIFLSLLTITQSYSAEPIAKFTSSSNLSEWVIDNIDSATNSVKVMVFLFEWEPIANSLINASSRGVDVEVITDSRSLTRMGKPSSQMHIPERLRQHNINCYIYRNPYSIMHHKAIFIDKQVLMVGSYNFTQKATDINCENLIKIDNKKLYDQYMIEYQRIKTSTNIYKADKTDFVIKNIVANIWIKHKKLLSLILVVSLFLNFICVVFYHRTKH